MAHRSNGFTARWGMGLPAVASLVAADFFITLDGSAVIIALPAIRDTFDADMAALQWTQMAYMLAGAALAIPFGSIGDRLGRTKVLIIALALFSVGAVVTTLAPSIGVLICGRALTGAGAAGISVLALAILRSGVTEDRVSFVVGAWVSLSTVSSVIAPAFSGLMVETFSWRWVFAFSILPIILIAFVIRRISEPTAATAERIDWTGTGLLTAATVLIAGALDMIAFEAPSIAVVSLTLGLGAVGAGVFLRQQRRSPTKLADWSALSGRSIPTILTSKLVITVAVTGLMFQQTLLMQNGLDFSPFVTGLIDIVPALTAVLLAAKAAWIVKRLGLPATTLCAFGSLAIGMLGMSRADQFTSLAAIMASFVAIGTGFGLSGAALSSAVMQRVPASGAGSASGALTMLNQLAAAIGIALVGALVAIQIRDAWSSRGAVTCPTNPDLVTDILVGSMDEITDACGIATGTIARAALIDGTTDALVVGGVVLAVTGLITWLKLRAPAVTQEGANASS